jgi:Ca2+-binding RTX toxin-like protein
MTTIPSPSSFVPSRSHRHRALALVLLAAASVALAWALGGGGHAGAASPFSGEVTAGTLYVRGSSGDDTIVLRLRSGAPNTLDVDFGDDGIADLSFDRNTFGSIHVAALGGADFVRMDESAGVFTDTEATTIDGGGGNDTLIGGVGAEVILGQGGADLVDPNRGNDVVLLGGGADTVVWDPGDGSDIIEGGSGLDTLMFNGSAANEVIDVAANGSRVRLFRNVGSIVMDLNDLENMTVRTFAGEDTVVVNDLGGTAARTVEVDLAAAGGGGDTHLDTVVVNATPGADVVQVTAQGATAAVEGLSNRTSVSGAEPTVDRLLVNGSGGDDSLAASPAVGAAIGVAIDGGAGNDTVHAEGTAGDDSLQAIANGPVLRVTDGGAGFFDVLAAETVQLNGKAGNDTLLTAGNVAGLVPLLVFDGGSGDDVILGGNGADVILAGGGNDVVHGRQGNDLVLLGGGADVAVWDPGDGSDTIEGDSGNDSLVVNGSGANEIYDVSPNGSRVRLTRDVGAIVLDANGVEALGIKTVGGADLVNVNDLAGTSAKSVEVDIRGPGGVGDGQLDQVTVQGTTGPDFLEVTGASPAASVKGLAVTPLVIGVEPGLDSMVVNGAGGDDLIKAVPGDALVDVVIDGGAGVDTVFADGTGGNDTFQVMANGAQARVIDTAGAYVDVAPVETLRVNGKAGDDTIAAVGNLAALIASLVLDGGGGNDLILGGNGADVILAGGGSDVVHGRQGNDVIFLGGGADVAVWGPGDGSDIIEGESGNDSLEVIGSGANEIVDIAANGSRVRLFRNVGSIVLDVDGIETIGFNAAGGTDVVVVGDLTGTATKVVDVDLTANGGVGDGQPDQVIVQGTNGVDNIAVSGAATTAAVKGLAATVNISGAEFALDRLDIQTLAGDDVVTAAGLAPGVIQLFVDGVPLP